MTKSQQRVAARRQIKLDHPVASCLHCGELMGPLQQTGRAGGGVSREVDFRCSHCGGRSILMSRRPDE